MAKTSIAATFIGGFGMRPWNLFTADNSLVEIIWTPFHRAARRRIPPLGASYDRLHSILHIQRIVFVDSDYANWGVGRYLLDAQQGGSPNAATALCHVFL